LIEPVKQIYESNFTLLKFFVAYFKMFLFLAVMFIRVYHLNEKKINKLNIVLKRGKSQLSSVKKQSKEKINIKEFMIVYFYNKLEKLRQFYF
jgi:hypothetical protein